MLDQQGHEISLAWSWRLVAAVAAISLPYVWLELWGMRSATTYGDQLAYTLAGGVGVLPVVAILSLRGTPRGALTVVSGGAAVAQVLRVVVLVAAGLDPGGDGYVSGLAMAGGAIGALAVWLADATLTGRANPEW